MITQYQVTFYNYDKNDVKKIEAFNTYCCKYYCLEEVSKMAKDYLNEHNFDGYMISMVSVMEFH